MKIFVAFMAVLLSTGSCIASNITYYVDQTVGSCPELRCDLRLSAINTLRGSCLDGKSFLNSVVGQGRNQLGDLPISFEASEFAFRQQQS